jgi:hypothetical protein
LGQNDDTSFSEDTFASLQQVEGAGEVSRISVALPPRSPAGVDHVEAEGEKTSAGSGSNQSLTSPTIPGHSRSVSAPPVQDNNPPSKGQDTPSVDVPTAPIKPSDDSQLSAPQNSDLGWVNLGLESADRTGNSFSAFAPLGPARNSPAIRMCAKCGKQLTGQFVHALGTTYHLECFRCQVSTSTLITSE